MEKTWALVVAKKITIENRVKEVKNGNITIENDLSFDVHILIIKLNGFLTANCRLCSEMSKKKKNLNI